MSVSRDGGEKHRLALSRLVTNDHALSGDNRVVPLLQEMVYGDMTFAVSADCPWDYHFFEVLDAVEQILEV